MNDFNATQEAKQRKNQWLLEAIELNKTKYKNKIIDYYTYNECKKFLHIQLKKTGKVSKNKILTS